MKHVLILLALVCIAAPVFAQDIDLGLGGDASSLLNIPAPRGTTPARGNAAGARGTAPARGGTGNAAPVDRLVRLRELLTQSNTPLSKEQEAGLDALLTTEIPAMRQALQKRVAELQQAKGPTATPAAMPSLEELTPEIVRLNDQLLGKMSESQVLSDDQRRVIRKLYKDQVKSRGGFDAIKLTMDDAGVPFSTEQVSQIQPLFDQQNQAKVQIAKDAQGQPPDQAKLDQLQRDTLAKVFRLLTPAQRAALVAK
jgi:hypothetical protein